MEGWVEVEADERTGGGGGCIGLEDSWLEGAAGARALGAGG